MTVKTARTVVIVAIVISLLAISGCLCPGDRSGVTPTPHVPTPSPAATGSPSITIPVPSPGATIIWTPGTGNTTPGNGAGASPTPWPGANETNQIVTPTPVLSGATSDWGTSKDTYARGDTATGWVHVTNTGNVPITSLDFTIVIKRTVFFFPVEKSYSYSRTDLDIRPGDTERVDFSLSIPAEYSGVSTAGDYQLTATAILAGNDIGSFSKSIKIV